MSWVDAELLFMMIARSMKLVETHNQLTKAKTVMNMTDISNLRWNRLTPAVVVIFGVNIVNILFDYLDSFFKFAV